MDISRALPALRKNNIRMVGIGLEELGMDEFQEGRFWGGELYLDEKKDSYKAVQLQSVSAFSAIKQIFFTAKVKEALEKTKSVPGNLKGDGLQLGATFAMNQGGAMLLDFRQQTFGDHPTPEMILQAFGLSTDDLQPAEDRAA